MPGGRGTRKIIRWLLRFTSIYISKNRVPKTIKTFAVLRLFVFHSTDLTFFREAIFFVMLQARALSCLIFESNPSRRDVHPSPPLPLWGGGVTTALNFSLYPLLELNPNLPPFPSPFFSTFFLTTVFKHLPLLTLLP